AHDVPLGCAPDEYDDLISGTCSHLPFVEVTNVVLFPRFITYDAGRRDHKVYAWGYEIMADVLEGFIPR
ncbi:hypothetical protein PO345_26815, partial [Klebsiella pneumoniae]